MEVVGAKEGGCVLYATLKLGANSGVCKAFVTFFICISLAVLRERASFFALIYLLKVVVTLSTCNSTFLQIWFLTLSVNLWRKIKIRMCSLNILLLTSLSTFSKNSNMYNRLSLKVALSPLEFKLVTNCSR